MPVFSRRQDARPPLDKALEAAAGLKAGSWDSVEALAMLAVEARGRPESVQLYQAAVSAADGLKPGSWDSVRALTWLSHASRELSERGDVAD